MDLIDNILEGTRKELMHSGIRRVSYLPYNMDFAMSVVERIGRGLEPDFKFNDDIAPVYQELIRYFHADPQFQGDLTRGILLMGPTGTGKTLAMEIMRIYRQIDDTKFILNDRIYRMNYDIVDVNRLVNLFMDNAFEGIDIYCRRYIFCMDDIGMESDQVKYYGNSLDVIGHIIAERYSRRLLTFGTTNFNIEKLEEKYSDRIVSRMHAIFNFLVMNTRDFRRNK